MGSRLKGMFVAPMTTMNPARAARRTEHATDIIAAMEYQLVLQFSTKSESEHEPLILLEDDFIERLEDSAEVDGHDTAEMAFNIFISTVSPAKTFDRLKPLLAERSLMNQVTAAFRHVDEEDYKVLWPKDDTRPFLAP